MSDKQTVDAIVDMAVRKERREIVAHLRSRGWEFGLPTRNAQAALSCVAADIEAGAHITAERIESGQHIKDQTNG